MGIIKNALDRFWHQYLDSQNSGGVDWPATRAAAVTPNDGTDLGFHSRALYVGGAGDVCVDMVDTGTSVVFAGVPAGSVLPFRVKRVRATGTTASLIVAVD